MYRRRIVKLATNFTTIRFLSTSLKKCKEYENPILRTFRILKEDFYRVQQPGPNDEERQRALMGLFPRHADIVIIGGGSIGSSIAYWLKEKTSQEGIRVVVIEKDMTYSKCSTVLSMGGLHQQFSLPENIQMSLYGAEFLRNLKKNFGSAADVHFTPQGYLVLADEERAQRLIDSSNIQRELGAINQILSKEQLRRRFPWMDVSDVDVGNLGLEREGWFDPWALLTVMKSGAMDLGAQYIEGEVVDFTFKTREDYIVEGIEEGSYEALQEIIVKMPDGTYKSIEFAYCIIAAGFESAKLAELAKIGIGSGMLSVPLPIKKRNRYVYKINCENPPGVNVPMTVDYTGLYFRRDGLDGSFIVGASPMVCPQMSSDEYFYQEILPILANRVPVLNSVQVKRTWCGTYENNCFDDNGIVGPHPYYHNLYLATGFSGHGIQQAPAVGRAVAELILDGDFKTIDLTRFSFDRLIVDKPMFEYGVF